MGHFSLSLIQRSAALLRFRKKIEGSSDNILAPFQITCRFAPRYIFMSGDNITKGMYLEKPTQQVIWDGGSTNQHR
jgi:hypothetical protein